MLAGRMNVSFRVRMRVVIPMVSRPPERTFLIRHATDKRQDELKDAAGLIRAMREVPVITGRHRKYAKTVEGKARNHCNPANARPKQQETSTVQENKLGDS